MTPPSTSPVGVKKSFICFNSATCASPPLSGHEKAALIRADGELVNLDSDPLSEQAALMLNLYLYMLLTHWLVFFLSARKETLATKKVEVS